MHTLVSCSYQETSTNVPLADLAKFVLASQFDLKFYAGDGFDILKQVYGDSMVVSMETIIQQLSVAKKAFSGLDLAVLDYVVPHSLEENPEVNTSPGYLQVVKTSSDEAFAAVLVQLASLLNIPNSYVHNVYDLKFLPQPDLKDYSELCDLNNFPKIDFTSLNNSFKMGPELDHEKHVNNVIKFDEVQKADVNTLLTRPIAVTTEASPCTLCLFGNMGPTPQHIQGEMKYAQNTCKQVMSYFTQPPFNMRSTVMLSRIDQMFCTCAGIDSENRDLVNHGVSVIPYVIQYDIPFVPNDINNKNKFPSIATDSEDETTKEKYPCTPNDEVASKSVTAHNSVKPCFQVPDLGGKNMCGNPIAKPLGCIEGEEGSTGSQNFENLFSVLLGCHWRSVISCMSPDVDKIFQVGTVEFTKFARLREMILCWLLIQLVNKEYNGFRHFSDWQKLHQRLLVSHGDYTKGFKAPTTARNLIYQCLLLVQATSNFRLSFCGGLGRHFAVVHSLLGVRPTETCLPLEHNPDVGLPPLFSPFSLDVVGRSNTKVEIFEIGQMSGGVFDEHHFSLAKKISEVVQVKDESLIQTDVINFLMRWCQNVNDRNNEILEKIMPIEFKKDLVDRRKSNGYNKDDFVEFELLVPRMAIEFICNELIIGHKDVSTIKWIVDVALSNKYKTKRTPKSLPLPVGDKPKDIAKWVQDGLLLEYKVGYVTRSHRFWIPALHPIMFIMSHCFYWLPEKIVSQRLQQFLQNSGAGTHEYEERETEFCSVKLYPNPTALWQSCSDENFLATYESPANPFFITRDQVKVSIAP